ncbi:MAG: BCCT family transporter [Lachnospiraceae bacterium]|nr:BCCT family transporter [Lachnospiraceae bacterium]
MKRVNIVFGISFLISLVLTIFAIFFNSQFSNVSNILFAVITENFSWLYLLAMLIFVIFVLVLACTKYGNVRLGADDSKPEYSTFSWFAMLFCAGMGVGLVFWGVSEPTTHFTNPMSGEGGTIEAAEFAFKSSFMHWGIQPWANYAVVGLALAYFQFRKNKPGLISSIMEPLIGEKRVLGWPGKLVDILAAFATVAGIVTSLGLGVLQINSGLNTMLGLPNDLVVQIAIIIIVTVIFMWSAISGINKGVKILSNFNIILALILMAGAFMIGPKLEIINNLINGIGNYVEDFVQDSLTIPGYGDTSWITAWRIFYWAWWIAWAPFVGIFIARISKGRTIREFVLGVVLAPTLASVVWFAIFGTLGIHLGMTGTLSNEALQQISTFPESGLFAVFSFYPFGNILAIVAVILLLTFFITSADSGTYVLAMLSSEGNLNPPNYKKIIWGIIQSTLAIGLLIAGGLKPLQTISIVAAFPFMFIMLAACVALIKALKREKND